MVCIQCLWLLLVVFFFSSRRRHTRFDCDWSSDVCSSDLQPRGAMIGMAVARARGENQRRLYALEHRGEVALEALARVWMARKQRGAVRNRRRAGGAGGVGRRAMIGQEPDHAAVGVAQEQLPGGGD